MGDPPVSVTSRGRNFLALFGQAAANQLMSSKSRTTQVDLQRLAVYTG
jgi:hypothetical protein